MKIASSSLAGAALLAWLSGAQAAMVIAESDRDSLVRGIKWTAPDAPPWTLDGLGDKPASTMEVTEGDRFSDPYKLSTQLDESAWSAKDGSEPKKGWRHPTWDRHRSGESWHRSWWVESDQNRDREEARHHRYRGFDDDGHEHNGSAICAIVATPEPATWLMVLSGITLIGWRYILWPSPSRGNLGRRQANGAGRIVRLPHPT